MIGGVDTARKAGLFFVGTESEAVSNVGGRKADIVAAQQRIQRPTEAITKGPPTKTKGPPTNRPGWTNQKEQNMRNSLTVAALAAASCWMVLALATPAAAGVCTYQDGHTASNDGPCVRVENGHPSGPGSREMNLWCLHGPTSTTHKIVLQPGNYFTCKGKIVQLQRMQAECNKCTMTSACSESPKRTVLKLYGRESGEHIGTDRCDQ